MKVLLFWSNYVVTVPILRKWSSIGCVQKSVCKNQKAQLGTENWMQRPSKLHVPFIENEVCLYNWWFMFVNLLQVKHLLQAEILQNFRTGLRKEFALWIISFFLSFFEGTKKGPKSSSVQSQAEYYILPVIHKY